MQVYDNSISIMALSQHINKTAKFGGFVNMRVIRNY